MRSRHMAYKRRPPPLAVQVALGVLVDGLGRPLVRLQERRGAAVKMFAAISRQQEKRLRNKSYNSDSNIIGKKKERSWKFLN